MTFEQRVTELGLQLPPEPVLPKGVRIPAMPAPRSGWPR
jgi:hypothetical protein